jgi:hypothetical protein
MPATNAGLGGFGIQHSLVEGTTVFGFWRDENMQDFVVMGVQQGISQKGYKETTTHELIDNQVDKGFNDPRRKTSDEYLSTADGTNPPGDSKRPNSLTAALDSAPNLIKKTNIKYDGSGSKREEFTEADKTLPYYPLVTDATDINVFATADGDYSSRDLSELIKDKETTITYLEPASGNPKVSDYKAAVRKDKKVTGAKSNATPLYPYNKALYTESGHIVELDDTRGNERISIEHRTGTFYEIDAEGNQIHRVVNDNYTVICKDNELYVGGKVNIKVLGDATVDIGGDAKIDVKKTLTIDSREKMTLSSGKEIEITSATVSINGAEVKLNS